MPDYPRLPGQPLLGTLNALNAPQPAQPGLSLPGYSQQHPYVPPQDPGEFSFGRLGRLGMSALGAARDIPNWTAWNAGPALVGRPGQGPQNGSEMLERLGANPTTPVGRAFATGIDTVADPMNIMLGGGGGLTRSVLGRAPHEGRSLLQLLQGMR